MQKLIAKYGMAAHLAFLAVAPLFLSSGCCLWLAALGFVWLFMCPSSRPGEYVHEARERILFEILRDPIFWVSLLLVGYAAIRSLNGGVALVYDYETTTWTVADPPVPYLPASTPDANPLAFPAAVIFLLVVQACRHALGRSARYMFLVCLSLTAGLVALVWCYRLFLQSPDALKDAACELTNPVYRGSFFGLGFLAGIVGLYASFERKWHYLTAPLILCVGGCAAGLFVFSPPSVHIVYFSAAILLMVYSFFCAWRQLSNAAEFRFLVVFGVCLLVGGVCVVLLTPKDLLDARFEPYVSGEFLTEEFQTLRAALSDLSFRIFRLHPWTGGGFGSFSLYQNFLATETDWLVLTAGQVAPLNGYWWLLAECGIVGAAFLLVSLGLIAVTYGQRLVGAFSAGLPGPACAAGPFAVAAVLVELLVDSSLAQPGIFLVMAGILAVSAASFPKGE